MSIQRGVRMKNNSLIALALIMFLFAAWYRQFMMPMEEAGKAEEYRVQARKSAEEGAPEIAVRLFAQALAIEDSIEDRVEALAYYKQCIEESSIEVTKDGLRDFVTKTMDMYAEESVSYEMAMEFWKNEGNLVKCADIMKTAEAHEAVSDRLTQEYDSIKYSYRVNGNRYLDAMYSSEGIALVKNGDMWLYLKSNMTVAFEREFDEAFICNGGLIAVQLEDMAKLLNGRGELQDVVRLEDAKLAGAHGNGRIPVERDGKYSYIDMEGTREFQWYDYAGTYVNKRAAVRLADTWKVIDTIEGTVIADASEIALDAGGRCAMAGRIMAKRDGAYGIYDVTGQKLADLDAERVKAFGEDRLAAACRDGRWGFIDTEGTWVIEPQYEDAESFSNGYGAVMQDGLWGFIDREGQSAVECRFDAVRNFTADGKCLVCTEGYWKILEFLCK